MCDVGAMVTSTMSAQNMNASDVSSNLEDGKEKDNRSQEEKGDGSPQKVATEKTDLNKKNDGKGDSSKPKKDERQHKSGPPKEPSELTPLELNQSLEVEEEEADDKPLEIDEDEVKTPRDSVKRKKIAEFICDKSLRTRSYVRRRPIPLKRVSEIDIQCGTKSFIIQMNNDFDEVIYSGNNDFIKHFLSPSGLKISDVNSVLVAGKYQARPRGTSQHWEHDYNPAPDTDEEDEDFYDTVKNKKEKEKEARTVVRKSGELEYIKNPVERLKKFKVFREGIFTKVKEIDSICGVQTFVIIINLERDTAHYYGDKSLVSDFFTTGLNRPSLLKTYNVRRFDVEEVDNNVCCVPQCAVTRNTLSKWRQAAIEHFRFPPEIPFNLHLCPEEDRDKWIAEIDLDPAFKTRVAVCSIHFRDGYPTPENPHPTQLLSEFSQPQFFEGKVPETAELSPAELITQFCRSLIENSVMRSVDKQIDGIEVLRRREEAARRDKEEKRRKELQMLRNVRFYKFTSLFKLKRKRLKGLKRKKEPASAGGPTRRRRRGGKQTVLHCVPSKLNQRAPLDCRFCSARFLYTKALFQHTRNVHIVPVRRREEKDLQISNVERRNILSRLYPARRPEFLDPKKKYVCAVCKSVFDLLGLFTHMKEVHHGILCQYCLKLFKKIRDLDHHLMMTHKIQPRYYHSISMLREYSGSNYTLACADCNAVLSLKEAETHVCVRVAVECPWCRQMFLTQEEVEGHIVNGWCTHLKLYDAQPGLRDIQVVYKLLTGKMLEMPEEDETNPAEMMDTEINALLEVDIGTNNSVKVKEAPPLKKTTGFSCFDKLLVSKYSSSVKPDAKSHILLEDITCSGTIFSGPKSKGITNNVKKEFKDKGRSFDIAKEIGGKVNLDESVKVLVIQKAGRNFIIDVPKKNQPEEEETESEYETTVEVRVTPARNSKRIARQPAEKTPQPIKPKITAPEPPPAKKEKPKLETRTERIVRLEYEINENLKRMRQIVDGYSFCLFCQQCKTVSVDAQFLLSHFHIIHSEDGVNLKLGENAQNCISRIKRYLRDVRKKEILFNYFPPEEIFVLEFYRCSYCPTTECRVYEDLFRHTAVEHNTKVLTCNICHNIFLNYGSLISHVCSGPPTSSAARARFACKICHRIDLSSFLDFQTHIRKEHNTCEICFRTERDQVHLHAHCASHDQDLMCMKCFVTFEKVESFRKHMFWKHSLEQSECASCRSPTWPHVYHFCLPNLPVPCHNCDLTLPNVAAFRVHNRQHLGSSPHVCIEPKCSKSFISKSLLWKHQVRRHPNLKESVGQLLYKRKLKKEAEKFGAASVESLDVVYKVLEDVWNSFSEELAKRKVVPEPAVVVEKPKPAEKNESVLDAAIRSIMPESDEETKVAEPVVGAALPHPDRDAIQATIAGRSYSEDNSWQAGIDALLAGASLKLPNVPRPSDLPPDQLFQNTDNDEGEARRSSENEEDEEDDDQAPVIGGLWNQDLIFVGKNPHHGKPKHASHGIRGAKTRGSYPTAVRPPTTQGGPRLRGMGSRMFRGGSASRIFSRPEERGPVPPGIKTNDSSLPKSQWDLNLSESSDEEDEGVQAQRTMAAKQRLRNAPRPLLDHDYCYSAFMMSQEPVYETNEMDKIVSNVAFDGFGDGYEQTFPPVDILEKTRKKKKKKDKKRRKKKKKDDEPHESSDSSDVEVSNTSKVDMFGIQARNHIQFLNTPGAQPSSGKKGVLAKPPSSLASPHTTPLLKRGPKPKYHTPDVAKTSGVTAGTARPSFDTDSSSHGESDLDLSKPGSDPNLASEEEVCSSDLDTDFSADESTSVSREPPRQKPVPRSSSKPTLKLKIKLPPQQKENKQKENKPIKASKAKKRRRSSFDTSQLEKDAKPLSKKMRESLALNQRPASSEEDQLDEDSYPEDDNYEAERRVMNSDAEKEKLYCYCQCPHDDISEMIGCDAPDCRLEWFHFECVNIMVPPEGKWYCPECTKRYGLE